MSVKSFTAFKLFIVMAVAVTAGVAVNNGNWYLPVLALAGASLLLYALKTRVKGVLADERDYKLSGKASAAAIRIFTIPAVILGLVLYVAKKDDAVLFAVGSTLLYSSYILMLAYAVLFKIYEKRQGA